MRRRASFGVGGGGCKVRTSLERMRDSRCWTWRACGIKGEIALRPSKTSHGWGHNQPDNMEATMAKMMTANNIITTWSSSLALCENEW